MRKYLGETDVDISTSEFKDYTEKNWALFWIERYGGIDGDHHKQWVMDQVVRILKGTKVKITLAQWDDGHKEHRFNLEEPSQAYLDWLVEMRAGEDGPDTYSEWDPGIAP